MSAQSSYLNKKGLTVKDLVTIGIFTALFFVFELIGSKPCAYFLSAVWDCPALRTCISSDGSKSAKARRYRHFGHYQWNCLVCTRDALGNGFGLCRHGYRG